MDERIAKILKLIEDNMNIASDEHSTWWEFDFESGQKICRLMVELEEIGILPKTLGHSASCVCLRCYGVPVDDDDVPIHLLLARIKTEIGGGT